MPLAPPFIGDPDASPRGLVESNRRSLKTSTGADHRNLRQSGRGGVAGLGSAVARRCSMKSLAMQLEAYLELRHKLGFELRLVGGLLRRFVLFAQKKKTSVITTKLALEWATQPTDCLPSQWAK